MFWRQKKVLVTGGSGVIGRQLIIRLVESGAEVFCIDRAAKAADLPSGIIYCKKDILAVREKILLDFNPDIIFHLAASFERTAESFEFWKVNFHDNILVSHKVIDIASKMPRLKKFIFASSYLVYSSSLYLSKRAVKTPHSITEADNIDTRNLIGASKHYTENELKFMQLVYGHFSTASARIFRVYGKGSKDVVSRWVRAALNNEGISVYNDANIFDYIFAGDAAEGLMRIAEKLKPSGNIILNLGSSQARKISEVVAIIREFIPALKIAKNSGIKAEFEASCADISNFVKFTGWNPEINLESGIKMLVEYERRLLRK